MTWIRLIPLFFVVLFASENLYCQENTSQWVVSPAFLYKEEGRSRNEKSSFNTILFDLRFGYQFASSLFVGGSYAIEQENIKADNYPTTGQSSDFQYDRSSTGFSLGYIRNDYYAILSGIFAADWRISDGSGKNTYSGALGFQFDFGVNFRIGEGVSIGPRITIKIIDYASVSDGTEVSTLTPALRRSVIDPYFVLWFEF